MPKDQEKALRAEGRERGLSGRRLDRFIFGIMTNQAKKDKKKRRTRADVLKEAK